jgi:hypothetical protein
MRRFAAEKARRAVVESLRAASRSALAPVPHPRSLAPAAAMAAAMTRFMTTASAGVPAVSRDTLNPKVRHSPPCPTSIRSLSSRHSELSDKRGDRKVSVSVHSLIWVALP